MAYALQSLIAPGAVLGLAAIVALRSRRGRRDSGDSNSSADGSSWWTFDLTLGDSSCDMSSADCGGSDGGGGGGE